MSDKEWIILGLISILFLYFGFGYFNIFIYLYLGFRLRKNKNKVLYIWIFSIPFSFSSILSLNYGKFPISYFSLISFIGILMCIKNKREKVKVKNIHIVTFIYFIIYLLLFFHTRDTIEALKEAITVVLPFTYIFITGLVTKLNKNDLEDAMQIYLNLAFAMFLGLIIQIIFYYCFGIKIGNLSEMRRRIGMGVIFLDFSVLSLYFSTTSIIALYFKKNKSMVLFFVASIMTTARSGIISAILGIMISIICFSISDIIKLKIKKENLKYLALAIILIPLTVLFFSKLRETKSILQLSGREEGFFLIKNIFNSPVEFLLGIGLGNDNFFLYLKEINLNVVSVPHSQLIYEFIQKGLFGTIFYLIFIIMLTLGIKDKKIFMLNMIVLISSQTIPNIFFSRFYYFYLYIFLWFYKTNKNIKSKVWN